MKVLAFRKVDEEMAERLKTKIVPHYLPSQ